MENANAMSYEYTSNLTVIVGDLADKLVELQRNPDPMLRTVALTVLPEVKKRVHVDGKDSSGGQIGTYSPEYMQLRTGNYKNSGVKSKGANKGQLKDSGVYARGPKAGQPRPKYNRTADTKVIFSLTRQMENDMSVVPSENGYGIGYLNPFNFLKSQWTEKMFKKNVWSLSSGEMDLAVQTAQLFTDDYLKK